MSDALPTHCPTLSITRSIADTPIGNIPLRDHHACLIAATGATISSNAWIAPEDWPSFLASGKSTLATADGEPLAWLADSPDDSVFLAPSSFEIIHPWHLLRANEEWVSALKESDIRGDVHPLAVIEGTVRIGTGTRILPGVFIEGNAVIGDGCKIGPNCYIRGNTSIGDGCHIGQSVEIKNCLILSRSNVGHLSYIGDSLLGEKVNLGAGTTTSNLRHDGKTHRAKACGRIVDTGRRKFGAVIGDGVHTGIHTSIYPGRQLHPGATTLPGEVVGHDVQARH